MAKVTIIQVIYNNQRFIEPVFSAIFNQTFQDFEVIAVISGNNDNGKELLQSKFSQVKIIDPGYNIGFAKGHNLVFEKYCTLTRPSDGHPLPNPLSRSDRNFPPKGERNNEELWGEGNNENASEFFQLVNPDLIMTPNYIEEMLKAFEDAKVGAATGKLYKISNDEFQNSKYPPFNSPPMLGGERGGMILDTTGIIINKFGRAFDRGQYEEDKGQYDNQKIIQAVSAAGAMYRRSALEAVKVPKFINLSPADAAALSPSLGERNKEMAFEYFDEDFHSYWEDVDLTWRMTNAGWKCVFAPTAIGYHGRGAGSSPGGYKKVFSFIKHHRGLPTHVRQLNYRNHIFMYIKNSPWFYPQFFIREFFMLIYVLLFEISTLKVVPEIIKLLPKIWKKRKFIKKIVASS